MSKKDFNGKMKALTFSYDDAVTQDIRLIELFGKYNMKGTFNLNSEWLTGLKQKIMREDIWIHADFVKAEDVRYIYDGHEVAAHGLNHPVFKNIETEEEIFRQVEQDRLNLSHLCGYDVVGMAYPGGTGCYDDRTVDVICNKTGIQYVRTTTSTYDFKPQTNLYEFDPTVFHREWKELFELGERFIHMETDIPQIFYVWGHSYELDILDEWGRLEEFLQMMSNRPDICYCTNKEALL